MDQDRCVAIMVEKMGEQFIPHQLPWLEDPDRTQIPRSHEIIQR